MGQFEALEWILCVERRGRSQESRKRVAIEPLKSATGVLMPSDESNKSWSFSVTITVAKRDLVSHGVYPSSWTFKVARVAFDSRRPARRS